jgi:NADH-quinone oxidoreductase subunit M
VIFGPLTNAANEKLADLNSREICLLAPILFLIVLMGVYPQPFLQRMQPAVELTLKRMATITATPVTTDHRTSRESKRDGR